MLLLCRLLTLLSLIVPAIAISAADRSSVHKDGLRENRPQVWALQHATVVVRPGVKIEDATVVVRDGKISSVAAAGAVPPDARPIDMTGKTIYPGFIDAYAETTLSTNQLSKTAAHWNPNVVPQLAVADQLSANEAKLTLRKQGVVAQLRAPSGGIIRGRSAVVSTGTDDPAISVIARDVAQHMQLTIGRRGRDSYPGSPMGAVALARQSMYDAQWYAEAWNAANADSSLPRPERNDALAALTPVLRGEQPVVIETSNEQFFLRADRFAAEFGLKLIVKGSGNEYRRLDSIAATRRTVILPLNFPSAPNVSTAEVAQNATLESLMHWDIAPENPARVAAAGIRFAFTTDRLESPGDFLKSLRIAVDRGLARDAALLALTQIPAELFGIADQLGSVESGKLASFVITDGELFDAKTKVVETWVSGERFEHSPEPHKALDGVYELRLSKQAKHPQKLFVELTRDGKKADGRISRKPLPAAKLKGEKEADRNKDADQEKDNAEKKETDAEQPDAAAKTEAGEDESNDKKKADAAKENQPRKKNSATEVVGLKNTTLRDFNATAQFTTDDWGTKGAARMTLVFSETLPEEAAAKNVQVGFGQVVWATGEVSTVTVFSSGEDESKQEVAAKDSDYQQSDDDADDKSETPSKEDDGQQKRDRSKASFPVNYPLGAFGRTSAPQAVGLTVLMNATIWTCGPEGNIENGMILIDNGRIVSVGRELELPAGVKKIDVKGMHLTPGIIDCHSHMATDGGVNESTQAITCEVRIGDFVDPDDITIYRQLAGGVTVANILHGSANPIGGQNQVIKLRWGATGEQMKFVEAPQGVKFALGENVKQSNWGEEFKTRYPQTRMGVEQLFRDSFIAAREYGETMRLWERNRRGLPPRRDLELDALREIVEGSRWIHCHSYRQDEILALIRVLDEHGITIGTFQHILEGYKVADAMAKHGAMGSAFSDWWAYKFEVYDAIPFAGALMHEAGVVVSFNSDDPELATHLNQEAAKAVKYGGISEQEALKFVTLNPAKQLRIDEYVGSLEPGKQADLAVWNHSPLSNFSRCEQTWIDGAVYFDRQQDEKARDEVFSMRNTLIQKILTSGAKMRGVGDGDDDPSGLWPRYDEFCHAHGHDHGAERLKK